MQSFQLSKIAEKILLLIAGVLFGLFLSPLTGFLGILTNELALKVPSNLILQLWGMSTFLLSIIIVVLILHSYNLQKKFHYKKRFRFGVYWKEYTPFCPHCGGKLFPSDPAYLECESCGEKLQMTDWGKTSIRIKDAIEELKKDKQ